MASITLSKTLAQRSSSRAAAVSSRVSRTNKRLILNQRRQINTTNSAAASSAAAGNVKINNENNSSSLKHHNYFTDNAKKTASDVENFTPTFFHNFNVTKIKYDASDKNESHVVVQHNTLAEGPDGEKKLAPYFVEDNIRHKGYTSSATEMNLSYDGDAVFRMKSGRNLKELQIQWEQLGTPDVDGAYMGSNTIVF